MKVQEHYGLWSSLNRGLKWEEINFHGAQSNGVVTTPQELGHVSVRPVTWETVTQFQSSHIIHCVEDMWLISFLS